jgi:hypothetical protein
MEGSGGTEMRPEQEIRAKALEFKINTHNALASACIIKDSDFNGTGLWKDKDLEEMMEYITSGKKPVGP